MNDPHPTGELLLFYVTGALWYGITNYYQRKPMADFAYLTSSIAPSATEMTVALIFGILVSVGLGLLFLKNDVFEEGVYESSSNRNRRRSRAHGTGPR